MKKNHGKISVFFILILLIGINFVTLTQGSSIINNTVSNESDEQITHHYSTGGILLPESETTNNLPAGLDEPPLTWDWRDAEINGVQGNWLTSIKKQGDCGGCWAFAALATLESMLNIKMNLPDLDLDLSEQHLVSCCEYGCYGCRGGSTYYAWDYLEKNGGAILESSFPYQAVDAYGCGDWRSDDCDEEPVLCSDKKDDWDYLQIPIDDDFGALSQPDRSTIQSLIVNHGPVAAYITVYSDLNNYKGGIYEHKYGEYIGGHVVTLIGYNDAEEYWIGENSWGERWGEDGYFRIRYGECNIEQQIYFVDIDEEKLNFPPSANAGGIYHANIGETIYFHSDKTTDLTNDIISYQWDFGDGTTSNESNPTHTYEEEGMYPLTLTVTDEHGRVDIDESAVFVNMWDEGDFWEYDVSFDTDEHALYPPIYLPLGGSISNLKLEVTDVREDSYILDFKGDLKANLSMNVDRENSIFDFRMWSKFNQGFVKGSVQLSKAGFGVKEYSLRVRGFGHLLMLPVIPLPVWLPLPIDVTIEKTFEEERQILSKVPDAGKQWDLPATNSSLDLTLSAVFGLLSKTFEGRSVTERSDSFACTGVTTIDTQSGSYQAYKISSMSSDKILDFYYSPSVKNVVRFSGGDTEFLSYSGELISTNTE